MRKNSSIEKSLFVLFAFCLVFVCCRHSQKEAGIPAAPDYADSTQWYISDRGAGVDIFYITSTESGDYIVDGVTQHFVDTYNDDLRAKLLGEMEGVDHLLAGELNFFSPYYRQCSMETFADTALVAERSPLAMGDVKEAFDYYLEHYNSGRPFILAGFSQGGMAVVELLKGMSNEVHSRMVAAYVIGWKVTDADMAANANIVSARDSVDLGVTVCYNSARSPECAIPLLSDGNRMAINPLNWRTDATPAMLVFRGDTLSVALDTASLLLCVDGYTRDDYMLPLIGVEGNYHCLEISLYADALRHNISLRSQNIGYNQRSQIQPSLQ